MVQYYASMIFLSGLKGSFLIYFPAIDVLFLLISTGYESRDLSSSIAERNLPEARLMPEVSEFCSQKGISEYLDTTLEIIKESFPPVRGLHLLKEQDPEVEEQWLLIDITVDGSIDNILEGYDHYVDQWVKSVPESVRKNIRLSYSVY